VSSRPDQLRLTPDERADLVAYVDGELPEGHARIISTKLTKSATARREVEMLQKTWEMLDYLPRPQVTEHFSEKTVSHIRRLDLQGHSWEPVLIAWSVRLGRLAIYILIAGAFLGLGYSLTRWAWRGGPRPAFSVRSLTVVVTLPVAVVKSLISLRQG
jgi:anti-sigma factor RsiW